MHFKLSLSKALSLVLFSSAVHIASASPTPKSSHSVTGVILVSDAHSQIAQGFVSQTLTSTGVFQVAQTRSGAAEVTLTSTTGYINIGVSGEPFPAIGAVVGTAGDNFGPGNGAFAFLSPADESATDDTTVNPFGQPSETQIWQFNPSNSALTASWFDGTDHIPLTIFRNENIEDFADLQLTGDLSAFESTSGQGAQAVIFTFVTD